MFAFRNPYAEYSFTEFSFCDKILSDTERVSQVGFYLRR